MELKINYQGTIVEFTVVRKLDQGSFPKSGCNRFRGPFLGTFLGKQKGTSKKCKSFLIIERWNKYLVSKTD